MTRSRVLRLALAGLLTYIAAAIAIAATAKDGFDFAHLPLGNDFHVFYAAARLAAEGDLATAFEPDALTAEVKKTLPGVDDGFYWLYPPTYALLILPFAALPFWAAFWVWTASGLAAYGAAISLLARDRLALLAAFAFTGTWVCAYYGQNAFFVAALFGLAAYGLLNRRDGLAGVAIGLLAIKPHLALLFPIVLAASGRWRAFAAAAFTAVAFTSVSVAILGADYLSGFLANGARYANSVLYEGRHWMMMASVFSATKLAGAPGFVAWTAHAAVALSVAALVAMRFRRDGVRRETLAMATAAALLMSPYVMNYDLAVLAIAGVLLFAPGDGTRPARSWEQALALVIAMIPIAVVGVGRTGLQIGWFGPLAAVMIAEWRLQQSAGALWRGGEKAALAAK